MPLVADSQVSENLTVGLWKIDESVDQLLASVVFNADEQKMFAEFTAVSRQKEWLATRILLKELTGEWLQIAYHNTGKPYLNASEVDISISHTPGYAAVTLRKKGSAGIDIQRITPKILKIKDRFLCDAEAKKYEDLGQNQDWLHLVWGAKEALYKVYGDNKLIFKTDIELETNVALEANGKVSAHVLYNERRDFYVLNYEKIDDCLLVYVYE